MTQHILVTGGAGYIGSHTCVELVQAGYLVTVIDNFSNGSPESLRRVERITGRSLQVIHADVRDRAALERALRDSGAQAVVHLAGLKAVGESVREPLRYYDNNVVGTLRLLEAMDVCGVRSLVFSSSATVYGVPQQLPLREDHPLSATSPYGQTKLDIENMLRALTAVDARWKCVLLRYFNPVGAHPSGLIGEDPQGEPNNLMPYVAQVAVGRREFLSVWGDDYATHDGTGVRDYLHVVDLAQGHLCALQMLQDAAQGQCTPINLGTGSGYSVLDMVRAFEAASGCAVPYRIQPRRAGDVAASWADPRAARALLGWEARHSLRDMCLDTWRWQSANPQGYRAS